MKKILTFISICVLLSCTDPERARKTLLDSGFTHITITGHAWNRCGKDDTSCTGFNAIGPSGRPVSGAVGCGVETGCTKGCTVRLD